MSILERALATRIAHDAEVVRLGGLPSFIRIAWSHVESAKFLPNWHIDAMGEHLAALYTGEIQRLLINVPPGSGKSLITSVFFPVWVWTLAADPTIHAPGPATRFHYLSYSDAISKRDAERSYSLIQSKWFQERWGKGTAQDIAFPRTKQAFGNYRNNHGGSRIAVPLGGGSTGLVHAHIQGVDDPIKPVDTQGGAERTRTVLRQVESIWSGTLSTRVADPKFFRRMITMQRLHDLDLSGVAKQSGDYTHLMIPLRYEPKRAYSTGVGTYPVDPRGVSGVELMWPDRTNEADAKKLEAELGPFASAQLQQDPVASSGGIFKVEWLEKRWSYAGPHYIPGTIPLPDQKKMQIAQSWDLAFKKAADSDRVAGGVWGRQGSTYYLLDQVCRRMSYTETKQAMRDMAQKWPRARAILVEEKANGSAILDELKGELSGLIPVDPEGGKETRAWAVTPLFQAGNVILPHPTILPAVTEYVTEMSRFPKAPHDDFVDSTTQALNYLSLHAPKWTGAMTAMLEREKAGAIVPEPEAQADPPIPAVDVEALRAKLRLSS